MFDFNFVKYNSTNIAHYTLNSKLFNGDLTIQVLT